METVPAAGVATTDNSLCWRRLFYDRPVSPTHCPAREFGSWRNLRVGYRQRGAKPGSKALAGCQAEPSGNRCGYIFAMMPQAMRPPEPPMGWVMWSSGFSWMMTAEPSSSSSAGMSPAATETRVVKNSARAEPSAAT